MKPAGGDFGLVRLRGVGECHWAEGMALLRNGREERARRSRTTVSALSVSRSELTFDSKPRGSASRPLGGPKLLDFATEAARRSARLSTVPGRRARGGPERRGRLHP